MALSSCSLLDKPGGGSSNKLAPLAAIRLLIVLVLASFSVVGIAQTKPLNDTGITYCSATTAADSAQCLSPSPAGQDARNGRDAQALAGQLTKVGGSGGVNGFDYTKISNAGSTLPATAGLGADLNAWACTRDNVTGLIWEVKTISGLRHNEYRYRWVNTAFVADLLGSGETGTCQTAGRCTTEKFTADVNATALCGYTDWRMPTPKELEGIVNYAVGSPAIDPVYFPNSQAQPFWTSLPAANDSSYSWMVHFIYGAATYDFRENPLFARLVRGR